MNNADAKFRRFDPVAFFGRGWSFDYSAPRPTGPGPLDDYRKVQLSTSWLEGESRVGGEERHRRILKSSASIPLNCDNFLDLWENQEKIPKEWETVEGWISFDADTIRSPDGRRIVPCLRWTGLAWIWRFGHFISDWGKNRPSAQLAI